MRRARTWYTVLLALLLSACSDIFGGCKEDGAVVELVYGSITYDLNAIFLENYRKRGWDCRSDGAIRNAFGQEIGTRYVCRGCDD